MPLLAAGHKRTGACPTFDRPVLQRDGYLVRIPLVGGALTDDQASATAEVAASFGGAAIELTNRGNLQVRGVRLAHLDAALGALAAVGLGDPDATLVTISPFAGPAEHRLRAVLLDALRARAGAGAGAAPLSPKFVVHVDDAAGTTHARRAELALVLTTGGCRVRIAGLGEQLVTEGGAVQLAVALADICRADGPEARVADVIAAHGEAELLAALPTGPDGWVRAAARSGDPAATPGPPLGRFTAPDGSAVVLAAARFGRIGAAALAALAAGPARLRVTPWRSFAVSPVDGAAGTPRLVEQLAGLGLLVDAGDPAAQVVACTGAVGCWQTDADTLAEAERWVAAQQALPAGARVDGTVHITGCDKRCATRATVAVTFLGRTDGSGFDRLPAPGPAA
jgi:precorrin-3B synthase